LERGRIATSFFFTPKRCKIPKAKSSLN